MAAEEIGFTEIKDLLWRSWKLIAGLAVVAAVIAAAALSFLVPNLYQADAKLLITPLTQGSKGTSTNAGLYRLLATSESVVQRTTEALIAQGILPSDEVLRLGDALDARVPPQRAEAMGAQPSFLILVGRHRDPETAAAIVNAWASQVVEESRTLFRGTAAGSERLLGSHLDPTNVALESAAEELSLQLEEIGQREEKITISWDQRISAAKKKAAERLAQYSTATRELMVEAVRRLLPVGPDRTGAAIRSRLEEIISVRAQLARTPQVLTLEKAASDETLSEVLAEGRTVSRLDATLVSEELNPLYDQLTLKALELESELKSLGPAEPGKVAIALAELERIQLERAAGLLAVRVESEMEVRFLKLSRGRALEDLMLEEKRVRDEHERRQDQLSGLAAELSGQLNRAVVSRVLDDVEVIKLAVAASAPQTPVSRQMVIKVAVAGFLGGLLGLMIALFRSADSAGSPGSAG